MNNIFSQLDLAFWITFIAASVRTAVPILLAALGEIFAERSGVVNINLEGQMLFGAFVGFIVTYSTGNLLIGTIAGATAGMLLALLFGWVCITKLANQIVAGITLNILALGITSYFFRIIFGVTTKLPHVTTYQNIKIPLFNQIPILGEILFNNNIIVYLTIFIIIISNIIIFRTTFGLKLRSVGEYPRAAETMGVNVKKMRYVAVAICGLLAGLGGAFISVGILGGFMENITQGRGFIALAIVIFGKWNPYKALGAALIFGGAEALQVRMQVIGIQIPYQFMLIIPYLLTAIVLIITGRKAIAPAASGIPYEREKL